MCNESLLYISITLWKTFVFLIIFFGNCLFYRVTQVYKIRVFKDYDKRSNFFIDFWMLETYSFSKLACQLRFLSNKRFKPQKLKLRCFFEVFIHGYKIEADLYFFLRNIVNFSESD